MSTEVEVPYDNGQAALEEMLRKEQPENHPVHIRILSGTLNVEDPYPIPTVLHAMASEDMDVCRVYFSDDSSIVLERRHLRALYDDAKRVYGKQEEEDVD